MKQWRKSYIKIRYRWCYFYHAIDNHGLTLYFELHRHRDYHSAYHFLKRLLTTYGHPNYPFTDQYAATLKTTKRVIKDDLLGTENHQCSKYCNNLIEQNNRLIKHVSTKLCDFQSLQMALKKLSGFRVMHQSHKKAQENRVSWASLR